MSISPSTLELLTFVAALVGLAYAGLQTVFLLREEEGTDRMKQISLAIRE